MTQVGLQLNRRSVLAGIGTIIFTSGISTRKGIADDGTNWPQYQRNASNTGYNPESTGPIDDVQKQWEFNAQSEIYTAPAVVDETIYVANADGVLYAVRNGTAEWHVELPNENNTSNDTHLSSPSVSDDIVYIGSLNGTIYAISEGEVEWRRDVGGEIRSSPTVKNEMVYFGSTDGNIYALDAATGEQAWTVETEAEIIGTPAVEDNTVYIGLSNTPYGNDTFYAIDASNGETKWSIETENDISDTAAVDNDTIFIADSRGILYALDGSSGTQKWMYETGSSRSGDSSIAVSEEIVCTIAGEEVCAFNKENGERIWAFEIGYNSTSAVTMNRDMIYTGDSEGNIYGIKMDEDLDLWRITAEEAVYGVPSVVDDTLYIGSEDEKLYAIGSQQPKQETSPTEEDEPSSEETQGSTSDNNNDQNNDGQSSHDGIPTIPGLSLADSVLSIIASMIAIVYGIIRWRRSHRK